MSKLKWSEWIDGDCSDGNEWAIRLCDDGVFLSIFQDRKVYVRSVLLSPEQVKALLKFLGAKMPAKTPKKRKRKSHA